MFLFAKNLVPCDCIYPEFRSRQQKSKGRGAKLFIPLLSHSYIHMFRIFLVSFFPECVAKVPVYSWGLGLDLCSRRVGRVVVASLIHCHAGELLEVFREISSACEI